MINKQDTPQSVKRTLIVALVAIFISLIGAVGILLSSLPQIGTMDPPSSRIAFLVFMMIVGIGVVATLTFRFFQIAAKSFSDAE